jgi:uncharacterized Zn-binding protein involved in type VI secretion
MGMRAARMGDQHVCPMMNGPAPHVGGLILLGCSTVLIGGQAAARVGDQTACAGVVALGSTTVFIGGKPAARVWDKTAHGGAIVTGCPTVLIGG